MLSQRRKSAFTGVYAEENGWASVEVRREIRYGSTNPTGRRPGAPAMWETGAYWLLYSVALPATWLHWLNGSGGLAVGCAAATLGSVYLVTRGSWGRPAR